MQPLALLQLLISADVLALVLLWPRVRSGPAGARPAFEIALTTLAHVALRLGLLTAPGRRERPNQAKVCSTTRRRGSTRNGAVPGNDRACRLGEYDFR